MDEIIIQTLRGDAEPLDERRLANWRAESPENEQHFQEVSFIWENTERASAADDQASTFPAPEPEMIVRRGEAMRRREVRRRFARGFQHREIWPWAAAAVLVVVSLGILLGRRAPTEGGFSGTEFFAEGTEPATVTLADGTFVRLAAGSRVRFDGSRERREAWLIGRGFFGVVADPERPFLVHTDLGITRVLGTRFEVASDDRELRVVVIEGQVALTASTGSTAEVSVSQVGRVGANGDFSVTSVDDIYALLDWPGGMLLFQATPLQQVMQEVSMAFGVTVQLDDPFLAQRTVTAWFGDEPLEEVVDSICLIVQAECTVTADRVEVGR